jgi:hypothetical protein
MMFNVTFNNISVISWQSVLLKIRFVTGNMYMLYLSHISIEEPSLWSWLYGSWIYNHLCNKCLSPITLSSNSTQFFWYNNVIGDVMMFNVTFNNISVISWQSVLLVKETRVLGENHPSANLLHVTDKLYLIMFLY